MSGVSETKAKLLGLPMGFSVLAGGICLFWALVAWLTVRAGADILAEAVQVQVLLKAPKFVLTYPGQNYGGVIEYPFLLISEAIAPGNPYAYTFWRLVFAFLTGFLAARLFLTLFPEARRWAFLIAVAVGPALLHGRTGPAGNEVGVIWLNSTYPMSWLLVIGGAVLAALAMKEPGKRTYWRLGLAGLLVGLGIYEQPTALILTAALAALILVTWPGTIRAWVIVLLGVAVGLIPLALSVGPLKAVTHGAPAHFPTPTVDTAMRALGLSAQHQPFNAVLPDPLGIEAGYPIFGVWFTRISVILVIALAIGGLIFALLARQSPNRKLIGGLSLAWVAGIGAILFLDTVMETVWFYGVGLSVLTWLTIGALPEIRPKAVGAVAAAIALLIMGAAFIKHESPHWVSFIDELQSKQLGVSDARAVAEAINAQGVSYVFGSYLDIIPMGYYSEGNLRVISNHYDRFALSDEEKAQGVLTVAVNQVPTDPWGEEAMATVQASCKSLPITISERGQIYGTYACPVGVVGQIK